ncbi:MAG TPA: efflux RND transporter periplasmic adaptor subunit [Fulvivirga sp.]|nr:efflux RND transporter periplasmic adaptor subunit [Fulvivirga sp.]
MNINKKSFILYIIATLVIGLLLGWAFFSGGEAPMTDGHTHDEELAEATSEIWTCSMHPQIRQNEPGDCPICGMALITLDTENEEGIDPMAISMSQTAMQLASVSTSFVGEMEPVKSIRLNGKVMEDERLVFSQSSHIPGRIEKLQINFTGEYVKKGQVIAYLYSPELVTAQEELFEARKIKDVQPELFKSAQEKLRNWKLSENQIREISNSDKPKEQFPIVADVSGIIIDKKVNLGDYINKGTPLFEIADLSKVWVLFDVYESDMRWIKKGDVVNFTLQSLPGEEFKGKITFLDPVIDPVTRVAKARVEMPNKENQLKPQMFASGVVTTLLDNKSNALVIPKTAVMWTGKRSVVYVKNTTDSGVNFKMREIVLGPALGESYMVKEGLEKGEEIAVSGTFSIDAAAQLAGKPSMMSPEGGATMTGHDHGAPLNALTPEPMVKTETKTLVINQKAKDALQPLIAQYLKFKNALVNDDMTEAQKAGKAMLTAHDKVSTSLFTGDAHNEWMKYSKVIKSALEHIDHYSNIGEIRIAFQQTSDAMIAMANAFKPMEDNIYVQFCPMADNNKGASWLSTEEEIKNPYFGASMLGCGEVTMTIK